MTRRRQGKPRPRGGPAAVVSLLLILAASGEAAASGPYPIAVVDRFIASCRGSDAANPERAAFCRCVIATIEARIPYERFVEWDRRITQGESAPELQGAMRKAGEACRPGS